MGVSIEELYRSLREVTEGDVELFEDKLSRTEPVHTDDDVKERFLQPRNVLPWSLLDQVQMLPQGKTSDPNDFLVLPGPINRTSFHLRRKGIDGHVSAYEEGVDSKEVANANAANSLSLNRGIDYHENSVRGSTSQLPFVPGGISMKALQTTQGMSSMGAATKMLHKDDQGLFDVPRGFERGIEPFNAFAAADTNQNKVEELQKLEKEDNELEVQREAEEKRNDLESDIERRMERQILGEEAENVKKDNQDIDELLPIGIDFARNVVKSKHMPRPKQWAYVIDLRQKIDNFAELVPNPARTWPFELDTFQKQAVYYLEQGNSVFVAAHTSAGKTVVAEYAIAMSKRNMTKTIYTSPIKALSNQKFRDFRETFHDIGVGLITGDVQINPEAGCLIMTTEILRSMLYRGADLIRDVEFVIFDEVHYVNDQDRGVVWEEVIIMLPQHVKFILLSATVPNTYEFANWIGRTKLKNIYVISTPRRPVPLEINIWVKNKLIPVINSNKQFLETNFKKQKELLEGKSGNKGDSVKSSTAGRGGGSRGTSRGSFRGGSRGAGAIGSNKSTFFKKSGANKKTWHELINHLRSKDLLPAVIFVFSKKRCEDYADWLDGVNFCGNRERSQIHMFIEKSVSRLKKEDRELPQIIKIRSLLERGIAVHHGGLLPIVKELIEMVFAKGLIRVLFATETFAMGLNLPTRTVVFSEIEKHDGQGLRLLNPGEFTQMAGRAGRRGLDKTGTVILMTYLEPLKASSFKEVTMGVPTKLESQFRLTYTMILNLLRIEALKVEEMIKYSFSENSKQTLLPEHEKKIRELQQKLGDVKTYDDCEYCKKDLDQFLSSCIKWKECTTSLMEELIKTNGAFKVLKAGCLIAFRDENDDLKLGFVFRILKRKSSVVVMTFTRPNTLESGEPNHLPYILNLGAHKKFGVFKVVDFFMEEIPITSVELVTSYSLKVPLADLMEKNREALKKYNEEIRILLRITQKFQESSYQKQGSLKVHQYVLERDNIRKEMLEFQASRCPDLAEHFLPKYKAFMIERDIKNLYHLMSDQNLNLLPDYEKRLAVLKDTGFIDQNDNVSLKGRVACEINSGYELVITELILDNFLGDFEPEEIVALLSAFVYEGRTREDEPPIVTARLAKGKKRIEEIYGYMLQVVVSHQVPLTQEEAEFLDKKRFAMMNVVYEWARGLSFKEIMEISVEAEGTVVRIITWLDEICRQVKTASIIIGNSNLHTKMTQAQELIKRDIVFAASLYL